MQTKIDRVAAAAETPRPATARPLRTTFTEGEINAYLALDGARLHTTRHCDARSASAKTPACARALSSTSTALRRSRSARVRSAGASHGLGRGGGGREIDGTGGEGSIARSATVGARHRAEDCGPGAALVQSGYAGRLRGFASDAPFRCPRACAP